MFWANVKISQQLCIAPDPAYNQSFDHSAAARRSDSSHLMPIQQIEQGGNFGLWLKEEFYRIACLTLMINSLCNTYDSSLIGLFENPHYLKFQYIEERSIVFLKLNYLSGLIQDHDNNQTNQWVSRQEYPVGNLSKVDSKGT